MYCLQPILVKRTESKNDGVLSGLDDLPKRLFDADDENGVSFAAEFPKHPSRQLFKILARINLHPHQYQITV